MFPLYEKQTCSGLNLSHIDTTYLKQNSHLFLQWMIDMYNSYPAKDKFFNNFFDELAGTDELRQQIQKGLTEEQIRDSWQPQLYKFKAVRKKYLLYKDFE
jgi:uncharacterized protein YbbC (DUF1343 family)